MTAEAAVDVATIAAVRDAYARGASTDEVIDAVLARIAASPDPAAWIRVRPRAALVAEARLLDPARRTELPLWGVPFAVKDNIDCAGLPTTCAFRPREDAIAARDAVAVARLRAAGAIPVGKTNLDQFATGLVGVRSPYGIPRCVFDAEYVSGGSSSGSAVAVARGHVPFALGTDTAGSGRVPAAFNHLVGVKPTRGLLGTSGVVPASRSLDCVSVFAASAGEAGLVRRAAQGFDAEDPYARRPDMLPFPAARATLGVLAAADREFFGDGHAQNLYARAVETAERLGHAVREIDYAPFRETARLLYGGAWVAERLAALEDVLDADADALEPVIRTILQDARRHGGADAFRAMHALAALRRRADAVWTDVDALLLPTAPTIYRVDDVLAEPLALNANLGTYTNFVNLLDCCAVAVPAGFTPRGLPFGVTVVAPALRDDGLAVLADSLHRALEPTFGLARAALPGAPLAAGARFGAVVRTEEHHSSIPEIRRLPDVIEEFAELPVHFLQHSEVHPAFAFAPFVHRRPEGTVDVVRPEIDVEGFVFGGRLVHERQRGVQVAGGDFGTQHPSRWSTQPFGIGPDPARFLVAWPEREREEFRPHAFKVRQRLVKSVGGDRRGIVHVSLATQVPLAEMAGGIAVLLENARQGVRMGVEPVRHAAPCVVGSIVQVGSDSPTLRELTRGERAAGGRANWRVHIELGKPDSFRGEAIDVRCRSFPVAEAGKIPPAHVINEHQDEVGLNRRGGDEPRAEQQQGCEQFLHDQFAAFPVLSSPQRGFTFRSFQVSQSDCSSFDFSGWLAERSCCSPASSGTR